MMTSKVKTAGTLFYLFMLLVPGRLLAEFVSDDARGWTYDKVLEDYYDDDKSVQFRRGQSPIGMTNFDRRTNLPRVRKGDTATGIALGILRLHPAFSQIFEVDDNVRLSRHDREADVIFRELPALSAEIQKDDKFRISGGYGMEIVNFADQTEENSINHFAHGLAEFYANNDWRLILEDTFKNEQSRQTNASSTRDDLLANSVQAIAKYKGARFIFEPGYTHHTVEHSAPGLKPYDYEEDIMSVLLGYRFWEKTSLIIQNDAGLSYYDRKVANSDQAFWQILAGIRGEYAEDLVTEIKGGFQARRLDEFSGQDEQQDYNGFVVDANLAYKISPRDAVQVDYVRDVEQSTFQNNSWYGADRVVLSYSRRFFSRWVLTPHFSWQHNRYPQTAVVNGVRGERTDNLWGAGIDLRYQAKEWLSTGIGYRFRDRSSTFNDFEYDQNRFIFDISLAY